jgi:hypothetical protein
MACNVGRTVGGWLTLSGCLKRSAVGLISVIVSLLLRPETKGHEFKSDLVMT